jgi:hypothetical protein
MRHHLVDHRRHVDEDGGPEAPDLLEQEVGGHGLREERGRPAGREGEEEIGSRRVAEVELGNGERDVAIRVADHALAVALGRVGEGSVGLDHGLGPPRRAAGEEPDRGIVAVRGKGLERGRRRFDPALESRLARHQGSLHQPRALGRRPERLRDVDVGDHGARAGVLEEVLDLGPGEPGIGHHGDGAELEGAEERGHEFGRVGERQEDPLLGLDPGVGEDMAEAVRQGLDLGVGARARVGEERGMSAPALANARVEEEIRDVPSFRVRCGHGKLARSRPHDGCPPGERQPLR